MQPRQFVVIVAAVLVAFGAAFGIGKLAGGSKEAAATAGKPAEVIKPGDVTVSAKVGTAAALPPLQVPHKKKAEQPAGSASVPAAAVAPARTVTPPPDPTPGTAPQAPSTPKQHDDPIQTGGGDN